MFHTNLTKGCITIPAWKHSLLWGALVFSMGLSAHAEEASISLHSTSDKSYSIPAGPLANTLREIARVSGTAIQFDYIDVQDAKAPAISGSANAVAAVQQAISNSGLTMTTLPNGAIQVYVYQLGTITVTASRSESEQGFKTSRSETATRSGADLKDVPQTITVVTSKVIEDQQAQSIQDVLANVAGVVTRESAQGLPSFSIRGFAAQGGLSNGVINPYAAATNVAGINKVEVLKGPQAILQGINSLSGTVNVVTKKPTAERIRDLTLAYGSHDDRTATVDISDAITDDKKLSYRVIGSSARAEENDAGFNGREADYGSAQIRWKDDATDLTVGLSYDEQYVPQNRYTFANLGFIQPEPPMLLGNPDDGVKLKNKSAFYDLSHDFSPWLTVISRLSYSKAEQDLNTWTTRFPDSASPVVMTMGNSNNLQNYKTFSGDHYLRFNFDTGLVSHKLSTGINHSNSELEQTEWATTNTIKVPVYGPQVEFPHSRTSENLYSRYTSESSSVGYYIQDLMSAGDFHLLLGVRRNETKYKPSSTYYYAWETSTDNEAKKRNASNYNAGLVYNLTNNTSIYASYSEGINPQIPAGKMCSGSTQFPDQETENKEFGIKGESPSGSFSWGAAVYELKQSNVLQQDPQTYCFKARNGQRLKGVELEATGRVLPGLNLTFGYTYTDSQDRGDSTNLPGAQPEHQANLFGTYDFQADYLDGFGAQLGITAYSESRIGYTSTAVIAPGGARVDAGIYYQQPDWSLRLGVKNLFDRNLYGYGFSPLYVPLQDGRTATITWKYSF